MTSAVAAQTLSRRGRQHAQRLVNLIAPGTLCGDRVNELDFRIMKVLQFGRTRTSRFDIYNV